MQEVTVADSEAATVVAHRAKPVHRSTSDWGTCTWLFHYIRPLLAELLGTTLLAMFWTTMGFIFQKGQDKSDAASIALCCGFTYTMLINGFGWIGGGHYNPAITLGVVIAGNIHWSFAIIYPVIQFIGAACGSSISMGLEPALGLAVIADAPSPMELKAKLTSMETFCVEMMCTMFLVLTFLLTTDDENENHTASVSVGFAVACGLMAHGTTSGAYQNPVVASGGALAATFWGMANRAWEVHYLYWLGPLSGGILAAVLYKLVLANDKSRWILTDS